MPQTTAQDIFKLLNGKAMRRTQPYAGDAEEAVARIEQSVATNTPIPLMMYWGKAKRDTIDAPEQEAIASLAKHLGKISASYAPGIDLNLVFVDTHVAFNGVPYTDDYIAALKDAFETAFAAYPNLHVYVSRASEHLQFQPTSDGQGFKEFDTLAEHAQNSDIPASVKQALAERATRYYHRSNHTPEIAGTMYYELCKLEQKPMGEAFKNHLFLTYNNATAGGKKHFGVPEGIPAICLYSMKRGVTDKPWNADPQRFQKRKKKAKAAAAMLPVCELTNPNERGLMHANTSLAVVGGGLAGLMSAYQVSEASPDVSLTLYERGAEETYRVDGDDSHRASLGGSAARMMRLSGAGEAVGVWNVRETKRVIDALQTELDTHPDDYPQLKGKKLFHPQASVIIAASAADEGHQKLVRDLEQAGVRYTKVSGAELKKRFPAIYNTVPDNAAAVIEEPYDAKANPNGVAGMMDTQVVMQMLQAVLQKRGAKMRYSECVESIDDSADRVTITSKNDTASYDHVILAPGQWLEKLTNQNGESITQRYGIQPRYDRVVVMDIDFNALGLCPEGIPFSKGLAVKGSEGAFYAQTPSVADGHVKFLPAVATRSVESVEELQKPITNTEKDDALRAASLRFGVEIKKLKAHTRFSGCAFTSPKINEKMLLAPLGPQMTFVGLDSSGSARNCGGVGSIAAALALGREEPHTGAYDAFSLAAHYAHVNGGITLGCANCKKREVCTKHEKDTLVGR